MKSGPGKTKKPKNPMGKNPTRTVPGRAPSIHDVPPTVPPTQRKGYKKAY